MLVSVNVPREIIIIETKSDNPFASPKPVEDLDAPHDGSAVPFHEPTVPGTIILAAMLCLLIGLLPLTFGIFVVWLNAFVCLFLAGVLLMGLRAVWYFAVGWMGILLLVSLGLTIHLGVKYDEVVAIMTMLIPLLVLLGELLLLLHPNSRAYYRE